MWTTQTIVALTSSLLCFIFLVFVIRHLLALRRSIQRSSPSLPHTILVTDAPLVISTQHSEAVTNPLLPSTDPAHHPVASYADLSRHSRLSLIALITSAVVATLILIASVGVVVFPTASCAAVGPPAPPAPMSSGAAPLFGMSSSGGGGSAPSADCPLTVNTTHSGIVTAGCPLLLMNTSSCRAQRTAAGLSGAWLRFSCRVSLTVSGSTVTLSTDDQPNYPSPYFPKTSPCWSSYAPPRTNPNIIAPHPTTMLIPLKPTSTSTTMRLGTVGAALNGVALFNNQAAPGDDIYAEHYTFDQCMGHSAPPSTYHYHCEPYALSSNDSRLIGVMRDGHFVYGRRDMDGSMPELDAMGGHTWVTEDSAGVPLYHYHTNEQTSTNAGTRGMTAWFLTTGTYRGAPGTCTGC